MIFYVVLIYLIFEVLIAYKRVEYALSLVLAMLLLIPGVVKFNSGINLNVYNISMLVILVMSLKSFFRRQRRFSFNKEIRIVYIRYAIYIFISAFIASFGDISLVVYIKNMILFLFEFITLGYCLTYVNVTKKAIIIFDIVLFVGSTIIVIYGITNYITGVNVYMAYISLVANMDVDMSNSFQEETRGIIIGRISSTFIHPLQLGQCALLLFSYALYQFRNKINICIYYLLLFGLLLMCILCGSRSAIFPLILVVVIYILSQKKSRVLLYACGVILGLTVLYPTLSRSAKDTVKGVVFFWDQKSSERAGIKGSSVEGRQGQLNYAFQAVRNRLLLGYGEGHIRDYGDKHFGLYGYESIILKYIVDCGILGLAVFILFYFKIYRILLKQCTTRQEKGRVHSLCLSFFVSSVLTGISYSFFAIYTLIYTFTAYNILIAKKQE